MQTAIFLLLGALLLVEIIGATSKQPTISEAINRLLTSRGKSARLILTVGWLLLGVHLFWGWLQ